MHKEITLEEAQAKMKEGLDEAVDTVRVTMGVRGKNVILKTNPHGRPLITNDGVTILRDLKFADVAFVDLLEWAVAVVGIIACLSRPVRRTFHEPVELRIGLCNDRAQGCRREDREPKNRGA